MRKLAYIVLVTGSMLLGGCAERPKCYFVSITLKYPDGRTRTKQTYVYGTEYDARVMCDRESRIMIEEFGVDSAWIYRAYEPIRGVSEDDCTFGNE